MRSRKKPGVVVAGTQCVDRWWQSLDKALPQSLHVKDRPGGDIAEKLMSYVWGFVWRSNLGNHANLTKKLGKIMWLGTNQASKWKKHFWAKWRLGESRTKKLQISIQNEHVCAKTTAKPYFHFHTKHKVLWGLQNLNMEKCLNQQITQGQISACDHKANHLTFKGASDPPKNVLVFVGENKDDWHWILV